MKINLTEAMKSIHYVSEFSEDIEIHAYSQFFEDVVAENWQDIVLSATDRDFRIWCANNPDAVDHYLSNFDNFEDFNSLCYEAMRDWFWHYVCEDQASITLHEALAYLQNTHNLDSISVDFYTDLCQRSSLTTEDTTMDDIISACDEYANNLNPEREYDIHIDVTGGFNLRVTAHSKEEALRIAKDEAWNYDLGGLECIDLEVCPNYGEM